MNFDIDHWITRATKMREEDGGYTFESLAHAMVLELGWQPAAKFTSVLDHLVKGWCLPDLDSEKRLIAPAARLYELLGWEQSALLVAWFGNLGNYRMVRDDFPNGGGIRPLNGATV